MPFTPIDQFISNYPPEIQTILQKIRVVFRKSAPGVRGGIFIALAKRIGDDFEKDPVFRRQPARQELS
jgi:hypothetical protein